MFISQIEALENLNNLTEVLGGFEPEVQLLVCDACSSLDSDPGLTRLKGKCFFRDFRLVCDYHYKNYFL